MPKEHRLKTRKNSLPIMPPLNFLLGCSQPSLENYELARLAEIADLRKQWQAIHDRLIELQGLAVLARWFRESDRSAINQALATEIDPVTWAKIQIRDGQRSEEELIPLPSLPAGAAHLAAAKRYAERNLAEGKCRVCPRSLARNSVGYCEEHLAKMRARKGPQGQPGSTDYLYGDGYQDRRGRHPGNLAAMAMGREQRTRALLAELGVPPESAAVGLNAAKEALLRVMPDKTYAMSQAELFEKAGVITKTTGQRALGQLLGAQQIQRTGKNPRKGHPFRYFLRCEDAKSQ